MSTIKQEEILSHLLKLPKEVEWVEFKEARVSFDFTKLGKYFSALSNEANLDKQSYGWLVFGIEDVHRTIVGTNYRLEAGSLDQLKFDIACKTNGRITFSKIYELLLPEGRVIMFEIPPAPQGIPTSWEGHYYGREGESLAPLSISEIESIRRQQASQDWSAQVAPDSTLSDIDPQAMQLARQQYKHKNPRIAEDVDNWDDLKFLDNARLTMGGAITHAAIILLGTPQSAVKLSPSQVQMSWMLHDADGKVLDYEHFHPPFIISVDKVFGRIRNLNYRYLKDGTLFPTEITQYDPWVIREALHNCIAHQDYTLSGRINITETPEQLLFANSGSFIPVTVEAALTQHRPQEMYRNPFLAQAMVNLNMIDTVSSGIRKMFETQRQRFFPMPDYDLSNPLRVEVRISGKILDENYTRFLIENTDLDLHTVILLDKVQKHVAITKEQHQLLKSFRLVEGRFPNIFVSAHIASVSGDKARYIKNRGLDDQYYSDMILEMLKKHKSASRTDIDNLLTDKLPEIYSRSQKKTKIGNLISKLRMDGKIQNKGTKNRPIWYMA